MIDCFETLVGITRDECDCLPEIPESHDFNITESDSGIYITDLLDIKLSEQGPCGPEDEYVRISRAMETAERQLVTDLVYELTSDKQDPSGRIRPGYSKNIKSWSGFVSDQMSKPGQNITPQTYMGARIQSRNLKGSTVKIKKAYVTATEAGEVTVGIKSNHGEQIKEETAVTIVTAGTFVEVAAWANTTLPLHSDDSRKLAYFVYTNGNENPFANEKKCTCGTPEWTKYITNQGFRADDIDAYIEGGEQGGGYVSTDLHYGIRLELEFDCSIEDSLCQITGDAKDVLARALAYGTCMKVIESIKTDTKASIWANVQPEKLSQMHKAFSEPYIQLIESLVNLGSWSPCYACTHITRKTTLRK